MSHNWVLMHSENDPERFACSPRSRPAGAPHRSRESSLTYPKASLMRTDWHQWRRAWRLLSESYHLHHSSRQRGCCCYQMPPWRLHCECWWGQWLCAVYPLPHRYSIHPSWSQTEVSLRPTRENLDQVRHHLEIKLIHRNWDFLFYFILFEMVTVITANCFGTYLRGFEARTSQDHRTPMVAQSLASRVLAI